MLIGASPGESVFGSGQQDINAERQIQNEISVLESDAVYARLKQNLGLDDDPPGVSGRASPMPTSSPSASRAATSKQRRHWPTRTSTHTST